MRRLKWAGHAWRKQGSIIIRTIIENNPTGKRPRGVYTRCSSGEILSTMEGSSGGQI